MVRGSGSSLGPGSRRVPSPLPVNCTSALTLACTRLSLAAPHQAPLPALVQTAPGETEGLGRAGALGASRAVCGV